MLSFMANVTSDIMCNYEASKHYMSSSLNCMMTNICICYLHTVKYASRNTGISSSNRERGRMERTKITSSEFVEVSKWLK